MDPTIDQFALPEEERRRLLLSNLMMGLGAGLLDLRGKNMWPAISSGLLGGLRLGNEAVANAQQGMAAKFKLQSAAKAQQEAEALNKSLAALDANPQAGMASRSGSLEDAAQLPQQWEIAMQKANIAANAGDEKRAEQYRKMAEIYRTKYNTTPHIGKDLTTGEFYQYVLDEQGNEKRLKAGPRPEYKQVDTNKEIVFYDPLTQSKGGVFPKELGPDAIQRQQQWEAEQQLRVNADRRAAASAGQAKEVKPQLVDGQWVYPPDAGNPGGRAVPVAGMKPKEAPIPVEYKKLQTGIENLNSGITEYINALDNFSFADLANPSARAAMGTKYNNMMLQAKEAYQLGVLNGPDYMILQQVVTNPLTLAGAVTPNSAMKGQAEELRRIMKQASKNAAMVHGVRPQAAGMGAEKTVVRTGTDKKTGRKVVQYSDGTIEPQ